MLKTRSICKKISKLKNEWKNTWGLKLDLEKFKVIDFSRNNLKVPYFLEDKTGIERNLRVMVAEVMMWKKQVNHAVKKAKRMIGLYKRTIESKDHFLCENLFVSLIRPYLEYREIRISKKNDLDYRDRLGKLNLTSLKDIRTRGDLIEMFKMQKVFEKLA